jgi:hypothetical protein
VVGVRPVPCIPWNGAELAPIIVLTFEWDALRCGDRVLVHDDDDIAEALLNGTVAMIDRGRGGRGSSDVGIRTIERDGSTRVRRPRRMSTHLDPYDAPDDCWRCAAMRGSA